MNRSYVEKSFSTLLTGPTTITTLYIEYLYFIFNEYLSLITHHSQRMESIYDNNTVWILYDQPFGLFFGMTPSKPRYPIP